MLERVTRRSFETLMQTHLFDPLEMTSAGFGTPTANDRTIQPMGHNALHDNYLPSNRLRRSERLWIDDEF